MKPLITIVFLFVITIIYSCNYFDWNGEVKMAYDKEDYDPKISEEFKNFDSLKKIMLLNVDAIFKQVKTKQLPYDNQTTQWYDLQQKKILNTVIYLQDLPNDTYDSTSVQYLPPTIYKKVVNLFNIIGPDNIVSLSIEKLRPGHTTLIIVLKYNYDPQTDIEVEHSLVWGTINYTIKFKKKISIRDNCRYFILCFYKHQANNMY